MEININGGGTLEQDVAAFQLALGKLVGSAMNDVGTDMQDALARHIETDVYEAYSPVSYKRRSENGGLGTPLNDMNANSHIYNHGAGVSIEYKPTGGHANEAWHTADGDALTRRLETKSPPYFKRAQGRVPPRPFWQEFVDEVVDGGMAEHFFAAAMRRLGEEVTEDGNLVRDANDGVY